MAGADKAARWLPVVLSGVYAALALPAAIEHTMPAPVALISVLFAAVLIALSIVDLKSLRLPDVLTLPLIASGIVLAGVFNWDSFPWRIISAGLGFCSAYGVARIYEYLRGQSGLGLGDAKLFAASGAWVGASGLASVLLYACLTALMAAVVSHWRQSRLGRPGVSLNSAIPFGPFLAAGTWVVWLYGPLA